MRLRFNHEHWRATRRAWLNACMDDSGADPAAPAAGDPRGPVFARSLAVLLAWHAIPAAAVILGTSVVAREPIGDSLDGLVLAGQYFLLALSLLISLIILIVLTTLGRKKTGLRRVSVLGNVSAVTGLLLSIVSIRWIYLWTGTLHAIHVAQRW
jgi:hypothetical protein